MIRVLKHVCCSVVFLREVLIAAATHSSVQCSIPAENVNQPESIALIYTILNCAIDSLKNLNVRLAPVGQAPTCPYYPKYVIISNQTKRP